MKKLLRFALPLAVLFVVVATLNAIANTTLSGLVTLPSPTFVMPGPIITGQALRLGESIGINVTPGLTRPVGSMAYQRDGQVAWLKTGPGSSAWEQIRPGSQAVAGSAGYWTTRAQSLAVFPSNGGVGGVITCLRDDFDATPAAPLYVTTAAGSATLAVAGSTSIVGGMWDLSSGATAGSTAFLWTPSTPFGRPDTQRFYLASRFAVTTAIDSATNATVLLGGGGITPNIGIGICGTTSTTIFQAWYDGAGTTCGGTKVSTGVSFVAGVQHQFEQWGLGDSKVHFAVDQLEIAGSPFTMAAAPAVSQRASIIVGNGATAATRTLEIDWWQFCWSET